MRGVYRLFLFLSSPLGNVSLFIGSLQYIGICRFVDLLAAFTEVRAEAKSLLVSWPFDSQHCRVSFHQS